MLQKALLNTLAIRQVGSIMKKAVIRNLVLCTCLFVMISCLSGCFHKPKQNEYEIETELGDQLSIKVSISVHRILIFKVTSEDYYGIAVIKDRTKYKIPDNPLKLFKTIGAYGSTRFYNLNNVIFYIYNNEYIESLNPSYNFKQYIYDLQHRQKDNTRFIAVISDLMKAGSFENIYQYGEILAYEENEEMKNRLQRYAEGDFTEEELSVNENSEKTPEEMMLWAKDMLSKYFLS